MTRALLSLALAAAAVTSCAEPGAQSGAAAAVTQPSDTNVVVRRLVAGPNLFVHAVFPEGTRVIVGDDQGNITVQDIASGRRTRLTTNGDWMESRGLMGAVLSRDGKSIAYTWLNGTSTELRVIAADGTGDRVVRSYPAEISVSVQDWTPAGDAFFIVEDGPKGSRIARVSSTGADGGTVFDAGWNPVKHARVSPDGSALAYDMLSAKSATSAAVLKIHVLDVATSKSRILVDAGENASLSAWGPDGKIYYTTRLNGLTRLWRMPGGAAGGPSQLVRGDLPSFRPVGFAGGSLLFAARDEPVLVKHVPVDPQTLMPTGAVSTLTRVAEGFVSNLAWSKDGARLAYRVRDDEGEEKVAVHSRATGQDVTLSPPFRVGSSIAWGDRDLLMTGTREGKPAVFSTDAAFARFEEDAALTALTPAGVPQTSGSADTQLFVRRGASPGDASALIVRNTRDGTERVVLRDRNIGTVRLSPDGTSIARLAADSRSVTLLPVEGGGARSIYTTTGQDWIKGGSLGWSSDSRRVVFLMMHVEGDAHYSEIWQAPVNAPASRVIRAGDEGAALHFAISADGRNIAYAGPERSDRRAELWVMEKLME